MSPDSWKKQPVLQGKKVTLRPITLEDTPLIVKWRNTPAVRENFIFREEFTPEMHNAWMKNKVATGQVIQYIIETAQEHKPVGSVYFRDLDWKNQSAEYGMFIGETQARGGGMGTETASLFMKYGFEVLQLHRISLRILKGNAPSYYACEKAGFVQEGIFRDMVRLDGTYRDVIFMAALAPEGEQDR